jgi:hypothetical protein
MKMDSVIPVEVARFRLGERLVRSGSCGATEGRLLTQPALLIYRSLARFPRVDALCGLRTENAAAHGGRAWDGRSSPFSSFRERVSQSV